MAPARKNEKRTEPGLAAAIQGAGGSRYLLAKRLGISTSSVLKWTRVPTGRILQLERHLGVPREVLRPDLYRTGKRAR